MEKIINCFSYRKMPIKEFHLERILKDLELSLDEVCIVFNGTNQETSY